MSKAECRITGAVIYSTFIIRSFTRPSDFGIRHFKSLPANDGGHRPLPFVSSPIRLCAVALIMQSNLIELLAAGSGIPSGYAGLAKLVAVEANRASNGFDRQVSQRIGAQRFGHFGLHLGSQRASAQKPWRE